LLNRRGILYAPDFVVNAGGAIQAQMVDVDGRSMADVEARLPVIRENLNVIFGRCAERGTSPLTEAKRLAESLIPAATQQPNGGGPDGRRRVDEGADGGHARRALR
jgi:leucine dehydrogenase